jgi:hypothetical protein
VFSTFANMSEVPAIIAIFMSLIFVKSFSGGSSYP